MTDREFKVGYHVFLKLNPNKMSSKLGNSTKIATILHGPFEIFDMIGLVAYIFSFPTSMNVHNVFQVSFLKRYVHDINHVIDWTLVQVDP
jgi:hypothetical protein